MNKLATLKFGEYLPDLPENDNPGSPNVSNVLWVNGAYAPAPSFSSLGATLSERPQGAFSCTDDSTAIHMYVGGATKLQEYNGTGFTDRSGATYTTQDGQYWKFTQMSTPNFGNLVFATNSADALQQIDPTTDSAFSATPGTPPKASQVSCIGEFIMLGDTTDATNGHVPYRVQWCGISDPTNWAYGTLAAQEAQAGSQYLNAVYGPLTHHSDGSSFGLLFQERAITRAFYVGGDAIFGFDTFEKQRGCLFPNSPVQLGNIVYFIAHDGFCMTDGQSVTQIGHGKTDTTFLNDVNQQFANRVRGSYDPATKLIRWCYCTAGNNSGIPDKTIAYNYAEQRFTTVTQDAAMLFSDKSFGYTMDTLDNVDIDLDNINPSLDSPFWEGGNQQVGSFDASYNYGTLSGDSLDATIDTLEWCAEDSTETYIDGVRPIVTNSTGNTAAPTASVLTRELENTDYTVGADVSQNPLNGVCEQRVCGRYVRVRVKIPGGAMAGFSKAVGADIYGTSAGEL